MKKWWNWLLVVALFCLLFIAIPISYGSSKQKLKPMFDDYIANFNKTYKNNTDEYETRFQHFVASVKQIEELNSDARGLEEHRARYGLTKLSDMSKSEYQEIHLSDEKVKKAPHMYGRSWNKHNTKRDQNSYDVENYASHNQQRNSLNGNEPLITTIRKKRAVLPMQVDWRTKGVVGPVRNQGLCGACWAFSTVGVMETMAAITSGKMTLLSVQEIIDCAGLGNSGCLGGDICLLLDWLQITNTAVQPDKEYPLQLTNGVCKANKTASGVRVNTFTCDDFVGKEESILEAIATHGPVTVAVNALMWQNYLGGVIQYHCSGAPVDLNHAVQLVGYDLTAEVPFYWAKNSWGSDFGIGGYLKLAVGSNICGLANEVASIDVKKFI